MKSFLYCTFIFWWIHVYSLFFTNNHLYVQSSWFLYNLRYLFAVSSLLYFSCIIFLFPCVFVILFLNEKADRLARKSRELPCSNPCVSDTEAETPMKEGIKISGKESICTDSTEKNGPRLQQAEISHAWQTEQRHIQWVTES